MPLPGLPALEVFVAVAKHQSFRKAAVERGVSPSALSHVIRGLEQTLDVRLFNRTNRSVRITAAGEHLLKRIAPALGDITEAIEQVSLFTGRPAGTLRLNVPRNAVELVIRPMMARFLAAYPEIKLEVVSDDGLVDIVAGGFDAGIRAGQHLAQDMILVPVGPSMRFAVVGAPAYFADREKPRAPQDLHDQACIGRRYPSGALYTWAFARGEVVMDVEVSGPLIVDDRALIVAAALDGRVARSFGLSRWRTVRSVYLPWLVQPAVTGLRLGLGVAVIGCLLSEIKLSNRGLGFLAIQFCSQFRIPEMYAVIIVIFVLAGLGNVLISRMRTSIVPGSPGADAGSFERVEIVRAAQPLLRRLATDEGEMCVTNQNENMPATEAAFIGTADFRITPGQEVRFARLMLDVVPHVRANPANRQFEIYQSQKTPGHFMLYQVFPDEAAWQAHRVSPAVSASFHATAACFEAPPERREWESVPLVHASLEPPPRPVGHATRSIFRLRDGAEARHFAALRAYVAGLLARGLMLRFDVSRSLSDPRDHMNSGVGTAGPPGPPGPPGPRTSRSPATSSSRGT